MINSIGTNIIIADNVVRLHGRNVVSGACVVPFRLTDNAIIICGKKSVLVVKEDE